MFGEYRKCCSEVAKTVFDPLRTHAPQLGVTNGTAAGTFELTGISGAYTGSTGLYPYNFTPLSLPTTVDDFYASGGGPEATY